MTTFFNPHRGEMTFDEVVDELVAAMQANPKERFEILIGTDSSITLDRPDFVSAIVLHRVGKGGRTSGLGGENREFRRSASASGGRRGSRSSWRSC
jgi:hypothetical protein